MPGDLAETEHAAKRKYAFVAVVLPLVLRANEEILNDRRIVVFAAACQGSPFPAAGEARRRVAELHEIYKTGGDQVKLMRRLDAVPPSLAVAQAAVESGWGTSRFAQSGNALFGQWTDDPDKGTKARKAEVTVATFDEIMESVRSYMGNLNTHPAFKMFRTHRAHQRRISDRLFGVELSETLTAYSARGPAYVRDLREIILANELDPFDRTRLVTEQPRLLVSTGDIDPDKGG